MKSVFILLVLATSLASSAAFAANKPNKLGLPPNSAALVMRYKGTDGAIKTLPMFTPGQPMSIGECKAASRQMVPKFKRQFANAKNFPEFKGWKFVSANCEIYSDKLLTTVK
jgi:hypothetical protein